VKRDQRAVGDTYRKALAIERDDAYAVARVERVGAAKSHLDAQHGIAGIHGGIAVRIRKHEPAVLPGRCVAAARPVGGRADGNGLSSPDCFRARILHIAEQAIDLGSDAIAVGDTAIRGDADRKQDRADRDDDEQLQERDAGYFPPLVPLGSRERVHVFHSIACCLDSQTRRNVGIMATNTASRRDGTHNAWRSLGDCLNRTSATSRTATRARRDIGRAPDRRSRPLVELMSSMSRTIWGHDLCGTGGENTLTS